MTKSIKYLLRLNNRLRDLVESKFDETFDMSHHKGAFVAFCFAKAYKTHASTIILCRRGNGQDAAILTRSLFEILVTLKYVLMDETGDRLSRWLNYDWLIKQKWMRYARSEERFSELLDRRLRSPKAADLSLDEIERKAEEAKAQYNYDPRKGWSDKSIYQMSNAVGLGTVYRTYYGITSNLHHSSVSTVNDYIKKDGVGFIADSAPSNEWIRDSLFGCMHFFLCISGIWSDHFEQEIQHELSALYTEFDS